MHVLWTIPELVQQVFYLLGDDDRNSIARVCRTFWLNAIPVIWREVPSFHLVTTLLPDGTVTKHTDRGKEYFRLSRALRETDWTRALLHTKHTAQLEMIVGGSHDNDSFLLQLLLSLQTVPIFPAVKSITVHIFPRTQHSVLRLLCTILTSRASEITTHVKYNSGDFVKSFLAELAKSESAGGVKLASFTLSTPSGTIRISVQ